MTTGQRTESLIIELAGHNLVLDVHLSTLRHAILYNDRPSAVSALIAAFTVQRRIGCCIAEMRNLAPGAGADTPNAAATHTLPASIPAPGPVMVVAGESHVRDTRGGLCHNCGEHAGYLVPSLNGMWLYCMDCADFESREEQPDAVQDEDEARDWFDEEAAREMYMGRKAGRAS